MLISLIEISDIYLFLVIQTNNKHIATIKTQLRVSKLRYIPSLAMLSFQTSTSLEHIPRIPLINNGNGPHADVKKHRR